MAHTSIPVGKQQGFGEHAPAAGWIVAIEVTDSDCQGNIAGEEFRHLDPAPAVAVDVTTTPATAWTDRRPACSPAYKANRVSLAGHTLQRYVPRPAFFLNY